MKLKDSLNRRTRCAPPQPVPGRIELTERVNLIFELLNRHGASPSTYLFELTRHLGRNKVKFLQILTKLYNGTITRGEHVNYLSKPDFQWPPDDFGTLPVIYDLNPLSRNVLVEKKVPILKRSGGDIHDFMGACCMASLQLFLEAQRYEYKDLTAILNHEDCPKEAKEDPLGIPVGKITIRPDYFFELRSDKLSFYAVEIDRKTETIEDRVAHSSYGRKLKTYMEGQDAIRKHYGIPPFVPVKVLTITTSERHMKNMQAYARSIKAPNTFYFSFVEGYFGKPWRVPPLLHFRWQDKDGKEVQL